MLEIIRIFQHVRARAKVPGGVLRVVGSPLEEAGHYMTSAQKLFANLQVKEKFHRRRV